MRGQPTRSANQICQAIGLGTQGVRSGIQNLTNHGHGALQLELRLLQDQDVVVRLELHLGRAAAGIGETWRPNVSPQGVALEQVRRVHRHADGRRELSLRAVLRHPRDLGFLEVRPHARPTRQQHQVPQSHPIAPRIHPGLVHHADDRDVVLAGQGLQLVHDHGVAVPERHLRHTDRKRWVTGRNRSSER